ncbi:MAG: hypothetical protein ABIO70_28625 [Pseudomonadota bacterium]
MDTAPSLSPRTLDIPRIDPFFRHLIAQAVPEMMGLAKDALERFATVGVLPSEVTPAAVVAMVLDDMLPRLEPRFGLPWSAILLQCALLGRLAELTEWELGTPPNLGALAS